MQRMMRHYDVSNSAFRPKELQPAPSTSSEYALTGKAGERAFTTTPTRAVIGSVNFPSVR